MRSIKKLWSRNEGVAAIEFVIIAPIMILLLFGAIEIARYILIIQKVEKSAYALTNIIAQLPPATTSAKNGEINEALVNSIFPQYDRMMSPYGAQGDEAVIFTSIVHRQSDGHNLIRWQIGSTGAPNGGTLTGNVTSIVNGVSAPVPTTARQPGGQCAQTNFSNANINASLAQALDGENMIIGEVFFHYRPIIGKILGPAGFGIADQIITRRFFMHPRNGDLLDLPPGTPVAATPAAGACP